MIYYDICYILGRHTFKTTKQIKQFIRFWFKNKIKYNSVYVCINLIFKTIYLTIICM